MYQLKAILLLLVLLYACIGQTKAGNHDNDLTSLVASNNQFAVDIFKELKRDQNIVYSPYSISTVVGMLYLGAESKTKEQLELTLHFDRLPATAVHTSFRTLNTSLFNTTHSLFTANRLYAQSAHPITSKFTAALRTFYNTELVESDFVSNARNVRQEINKWVFATTRGKIADLMTEDGLDSTTRMVLVNAVYFKGDWLYAFDTKNTAVDSFHINNQKSIYTHLMYQNGRFNFGYNEELKCKFLELPYSDERTSMIIILPDAVDGIYHLEEIFTPQLLDVTELYKTKVDVYLPKFKIEHNFSVKDAAISLGVSDLFSPGVCDLSVIDGSRDLFVSQIFHKSFVDVNEEGTEAAAATHATITKRSIPEPPELFVADHPFMFLIKDKKTNSILFLGRLVEPDVVDLPKDEL